jgi:hypothetical protein
LLQKNNGATEYSFQKTSKTHYPAEGRLMDDLSFYTKENKVDPRDYFQGPEQYVKDRGGHIDGYDNQLDYHARFVERAQSDYG